MADQDSSSEEKSPTAGADRASAEQNSTREASYSMPLDLINEPSVRLWRLELNYLTVGARDDQLSRVGDARWYIESLWDEMEDFALGKSTFHEALDQFMLEDWQPSVTEDPQALDIILSLIIAFTPTNGFGKLISYLKRANWHGLIARPPISPGAQIDLHTKALIALRSYHRSAPLDGQTAAFKAYLRILWGHLRLPSYFGIAATQLLDLEQLETDDARLAEGLRQNPEALREIIPLLLSSHRLAEAAQDLGRIYAYCLNSGLEAVSLFEQVVKDNGCQITRGAQPIITTNGEERVFLEPEPVIVMPDGVVMEVVLAEEPMVDYVENNEQEPFAQLLVNVSEPLESQYAELERQIKELIVQYVHATREAGRKLEWDELRRELEQFNLNIELGSGPYGDQFIVQHNNDEFPLDLPKPTLELLSKAYFDPKKAQEGLLALANKA